MYRFVIIVKYLTNFFKLEWNLGIKFTLRFFFLSVYNILIFFAEKMWVAFALQKLLTFFSKKFQHICVSLDVNFNESLTNNIVSFEQLGPDVQSIVLTCATSSEKVPSNMRKMFRLTTPWTYAKSQPGICSPFKHCAKSHPDNCSSLKHSIGSNSSVCGLPSPDQTARKSIQGICCSHMPAIMFRSARPI